MLGWTTPLWKQWRPRAWFAVRAPRSFGFPVAYCSAAFLTPLLGEASLPTSRVLRATVTRYANGSDGGAVGTVPASGSRVPTSTSRRSVPVVRASTLLAAPPAAMFRTISPVTSAGHERRALHAKRVAEAVELAKLRAKALVLNKPADQQRGDDASAGARPRDFNEETR